MLGNPTISSSKSGLNACIFQALNDQLIVCDRPEATNKAVWQATEILSVLAHNLRLQCQRQSSTVSKSEQNDTNELNKIGWQKIQLLAQLNHNPKNVVKRAILWAKEVLTKSHSIKNTLIVSKPIENLAIQWLIEKPKFQADNLEELALVLWQHHNLHKNCSIYHNFPLQLAVEVGSPARSLVYAKAAVRIDLAGGWTDTPPITYECLRPKPAVLNVAVKVNAKKPIECRCCWLSSPDFQGLYILLDPLKSRQKNVIHYSTAKEVYENCFLPSIPGSLICAVVMASGLVLKQCIGREECGYAFKFNGKGRAVFIQVHSALPHGSGMGTSSILSGALLACLWRLQIKNFTQSDIIQTVLKIEQLHTTGGGWQDQVGGLIPGGFKLACLGHNEQVEWKTVDLPTGLARKFEERLALVYTGSTRLAKNLLQQVVLSWLRGEESIRKVVAELSNGAVEAARMLEKGNFPLVQLEQYNELKKAFARNTETLMVKQLRRELFQLKIASVSWVAGAGGGGFLYVFLTEDSSIQDLLNFLKSQQEYSHLTVSSIQIDTDPLEIHCD